MPDALRNTNMFAAIAFAVAFFPLALLVARIILPKLRPPRYRPFLFVMGSLFYALIALGSGWSLYIALNLSVVQFRSRLFGVFYADSSQPLEYWSLLLLIYGLCIFFAGLGFAGIALCFRKPSQQGLTIRS